MEHIDLREDDASTEEVAEMLESDDVLSLGRSADEERRRLFDDGVYYGGLTEPDDLSGTGYAEVSLECLGDVRTEDVDAFVGGVEDGFDRHDQAWEAGVPTDYAVGYGDREAVEVAKELMRLKEVDGDLRGVEMVPVGRTTAYRDLAAAATARLLLDDVHVRLDRRKAGKKLVQTALEFGVDDVGFVENGEDVREVELLACDLGLTAVKRGGGSVW